MSNPRGNALLGVARALRETASALEALAQDTDHHPAPTASQTATAAPWNVLLWQAPVDARLTAEQAAEALGISLDALYTRTSRIPHRRLGGRLVFTVADLRQYVRDFEIRADR